MLSDGINTYTWDALNRLVQVKQNGTVLATYLYDSQNRRIGKTANSTATYYAYDLDSRLISEIQADGTPIRDYVYLNNEPLAVREYQKSPGLYFFLNDHLGTPQKLINSAGAVVWAAAYLSYGEAQVQANSTVTNNLRFPGQYYDEETDLHYNWNRYYDPVLGRYLSPDPIGLEGGLNLYGYANQNPINYIDPNGQFVIALPLVFGGAASLEAITGALTGIGLGMEIAILWHEWVDNPEASREHDEYKERYRQPPPPGLDECELLKWKLAREQRLLQDRIIGMKNGLLPEGMLYLFNKV